MFSFFLIENLTQRMREVSVRHPKRGIRFVRSVWIGQPMKMKMKMKMIWAKYFVVVSFVVVSIEVLDNEETILLLL